MTFCHRKLFFLCANTLILWQDVCSSILIHIFANQLLSLKIKHPNLVIQTTCALHLNIQKYYLLEARQTVVLCEEQNEFKVTHGKEQLSHSAITFALSYYFKSNSLLKSDQTNLRILT